ncbi:MAG TPA: DUF2071 domain-containing protein [Chloroflexia bacterium]|nr:DUF2071 domain-containing protein [Chloroflexia bacterium]
MSLTLAAGAAARPALRAGRFLEQALLLSLACHLLAMLSMAALLLPGMPGGLHAGVAGRMAYVADHPWLWRLGWLPWQLTALSDLLLALALLRAPIIPRRPAVLTFAATVVALLPDQIGQFLWVTYGVDLAGSGNLAAYSAFEAVTFPWVGGVAALLYTLAAVGWTWCFAGAGIWARALAPYSAAVWALFAFAALSPILPATIQPPAALIAAANALGFVLLALWMSLVLELLLRRTRPAAVHGRYAPWRHPRPILGRPIALIANSRLLRTICEYMPTVAFLSDITDVFYVNYIVEADRLAPLVPPGLELQRLGPGGRYAFFTFLSYNHGHFGPALLGPLRRLLPSPVQTNWRIHVRDPRTGVQGIYFVTNAINSTLHALPARMLSEGMPMHVLRRAAIRATGDGGWQMALNPGPGTAPDAHAVLHPAAGPPVDGPWRACFPSYLAMLAYCVPQDRAMSSQPWHARITRQEIHLGIPLAACEPLAGTVVSQAAQAFVGNATPFCFRVAQVAFRFDREEHDPLYSTMIPMIPT